MSKWYHEIEKFFKLLLRQDEQKLKTICFFIVFLNIELNRMLVLMMLIIKNLFFFAQTASFFNEIKLS